MTVKAFEPQAFERAVIDSLRDEMSRQGVSRRVLSEKTGISKSRVIRLFADDGPLSPVTVTVLDSVCAALGVRMSAILAAAEARLTAETTGQSVDVVPAPALRAVPSSPVEDMDEEELPDFSQMAARRVEDTPEAREDAFLDSLGEESQE